MLLAEAIIVGLDVETTGLDVWSDRVIEVASGYWENGRLRMVRSTVVCPDIPIPAEAARVNGLSDSKIAGAPRLAAVMTAMGGFFPGCHAWMAHYAVFDRGMLVHDGLRQGAGVYVPRMLLDGPWLDTRLLARALDDAPAGAHGYSLIDLCKRLEVDPGESHRAEDDVRAMFGVFAKMLPHLPSTLEGCLALQAAYVAKGRGER